ncbi:MAG: hypothetical protein ACREP0_11190 [Rhodanobacteraceae bacterium]
MRTVLFAHDFIVNVALCLPAACVLCRLRPRRLALYLVAAILPGFVWEYRPVFTHFSDYPGAFVPGMIMTIFMLPVATLVVALLARRSRTRRSAAA